MLAFGIQVLIWHHADTPRSHHADERVILLGILVTDVTNQYGSFICPNKKTTPAGDRKNSQVPSFGGHVYLWTLIFMTSNFDSRYIAVTYNMILKLRSDFALTMGFANSSKKMTAIYQERTVMDKQMLSSGTQSIDWHFWNNINSTSERVGKYYKM